MYTRKIRLFLLVSIFCQVNMVTQAQDLSNNQWGFLVEPYLMFPFMNGSTGVGNLPNVSVDASASDIFSNLSVGAMLYTEAYTQKWAIGSDLIYMNLKEDVKTGTAITDGSLQAKQFAWELSGLRSVLPWLDVGVGGRFNSLTAEVDLSLTTLDGPSTRNRSSKESWFDPIIIARIKNQSGEKLLYQFRGDIGGFGVGSQFTYQLQAYVGYRFSDLFQLTAGYRIISIDYEKGADENRFLYDVNTSGPTIRFGFNL
ncbi:hypothetical protein [Algoriphagus resistens]|uniref:hypothetical protein n=1 Tax=Algoriphagus resistens TaxID=1750590 RepID=UPI000A975DAD|nr:hypothetical protein [Algoriphagus resistens]